MSQLSAVCQRLGIRIEAELSGEEIPPGFVAGSLAWKVRLRFKGRQLTTSFFTGPALCKEPTAADVLSCLVSDVSFGEMSFEEFVSELGLDSDSRKAEATWKKCEAIAPRVRRFLGESFDRVQQAEH